MENITDNDNNTCAAIPGEDIFKEFKLNFTCVNFLIDTSPVDQLQIEVNIETPDMINCKETLNLYHQYPSKNPDCSGTVVRNCQLKDSEKSSCNFSCKCQNDDGFGSLFVAKKNDLKSYKVINICDLNVYLLEN